MILEYKGVGTLGWNGGKFRHGNSAYPVFSKPLLPPLVVSTHDRSLHHGCQHPPKFRAALSTPTRPTLTGCPHTSVPLVAIWDDAKADPDGPTPGKLRCFPLHSTDLTLFDNSDHECCLLHQSQSLHNPTTPSPCLALASTYPTFAPTYLVLVSMHPIRVSTYPVLASPHPHVRCHILTFGATSSRSVPHPHVRCHVLNLVPRPQLVLISASVVWTRLRVRSLRSSPHP